MWRAKDLSGLLLLYSAKGSADGFKKLVHLSREHYIKSGSNPCQCFAAGCRAVYVESQRSIWVAASLFS